MSDVFEWSRRVLETTPRRWQDLAGSLPLELLTQSPAPGEWSAVQCLLHLIDTERGVFPARVRHFLLGQDFPAFNPDAEGSGGGSLSPQELAGELTRLRQGSLELFGQLKPADLVRQARHQELGLVTLEQMLYEWAGHDLNHTVQAEIAVMQPFIRGCGPWQVYFKDHSIDPGVTR